MKKDDDKTIRLRGGFTERATVYFVASITLSALVAVVWTAILLATGHDSGIPYQEPYIWLIGFIMGGLFMCLPDKNK